jgi:hypothetical protein
VVGTSNKSVPEIPIDISQRSPAKSPPSASGISALRLGKGVRVLRVFRLIRVLKGGGILQEINGCQKHQFFMDQL